VATQDIIVIQTVARWQHKLNIVIIQTFTRWQDMAWQHSIHFMLFVCYNNRVSYSLEILISIVA